MSYLINDMVCPHCGKGVRAHWIFCACCGSRQGTITLRQARFELAGPGPHSISFEQEGPAPIFFTVVAVTPLTVSPISGHAQRLQTISVEWEDERISHAEFEILTADSRRLSIWETDAFRRRTVTCDLVQRKFDVRPFPATAVFTPNRRARKLTLSNFGTGTWQIARIEKPPRVRCQHDPSIVIGRHGEVALEVEIDAGAENGDLTIHLAPADNHGAEGGRLVVPVAVIAGEMNGVPDVHVGVDFGTSNTSVAYRQRGTPTAQALDIFGQGSRIPTEVYCTPGVPPRDWKYGREAFVEYSNQGMRGPLVSGMKSVLREDPDRTITNGEVTYRQVLVEFLKQLLTSVILPFVGKHNEEALEGRIEFMFSVPVLDDDVEQAHYREVLLTAAREAGYGAYGTISTCLEPTGAASYLLREMKVPVQPGRKLVVFDSGGGTTDICVGTVEQRDGQLELRDIRTESAPFHGRQFGGTTVTWVMGRLWSMDDDAAKGYVPALRELASSLQPSPESDGPDASSESRETFLEHSSPDDNAPEWRVWSWPKKYVGLWRLVDGAKIDASVADSSVKVGGYEVLQSGSDNPLVVSPALLTSISNNFVKGCRTLLSEVLGANEVCFVGGNCRLPGLMSNVADAASPRMSHPVPGNDLDLAVAKGAVWISEWMRGGLPYGLAVVFQSGIPKEIRLGSQFVLGHAERVGTSYEVDPNQTCSVEAMIVLPDGSRTPLLSEQAVLSGFDERRLVQMRVRVEQGHLRFSVETSGEIGHGEVHWERRYEI